MFQRVVDGVRSGAELVAVAGCAYAFHKYIGSPGVVQGASMMPTFPACCSVVWFSNVFNTIEVGDVVAAKSPGSGERQPGIVKRVRGVAGDVIFNEETNEIVKIAPGHVWVQGDNPTESRDSRSYGPIPLSSITAKVVCQIWPWPQRVPSLDKEELNRIRLLHN